MKLFAYEGKKVRILLKDGEIFTGYAYDYTSAYDNDPDPASISIGQTEIFEPEIERIEQID